MDRRLAAARLRRRRAVPERSTCRCADRRPPRSATTSARCRTGSPASTPVAATTAATPWSTRPSAAATSAATGCPAGRSSPPTTRRGRCSGSPPTCVGSRRSSASSPAQPSVRDWVVGPSPPVPSSCTRSGRGCWRRTRGSTTTAAPGGTCARSAPPGSTPSSPSATASCLAALLGVPAPAPGFLAGLGLRRQAGTRPAPRRTRRSGCPPRSASWRCAATSSPRSTSLPRTVLVVRERDHLPQRAGAGGRGRAVGQGLRGRPRRAAALAGGGRRRLLG